MAGSSLFSSIQSLKVQGSLSRSTDLLARTFERLSSGSRINRPSDDAAGLSVSAGLRTGARVYSQAIRNVTDAQSAFAIAEGALSQLSGIGTRIMELSTQAANGAYSFTQRKALNTEANQLVDEFNRIISASTFNGLRLFDRSLFSGMRIQAGYGDDGSLNLGLGGDLSRAVGTGGFASGSGYNRTGRELEIADLNNDGNNDLIRAGTDEIWISMGNGDGTFQAEVSVALTGSAFGWAKVMTGDFNGDGKKDLAVYETLGNIARTLLGNGDGTFSISQSMNVINNMTGDEVADFNNDGFDDLVFQRAGTIYLYRSNGDGTFAAMSTLSASGAATGDSTLADLNRDGILDIITTTGTALNVFLGNGNGTFKARTTYALSGSQGREVVAGDYDGDGNIDVAVATAISPAVTIYRGLGDGTLAAGVSYSVGVAAYYLKQADLNGDGIPDLVTRASNGNSIVALMGRGDGTFSAAATLSIGANFGLALADLNGDGVIDIAGGSGANQISVFYANTKESGNLQRLSLHTRKEALESLEIVKGVMDRIKAELGSIGGSQSRLLSAQQLLASIRENYLSAESRISDIDVAEESAKAVRQNIIQQTATALLAQANQQPSIALSLLGVS